MSDANKIIGIETKNINKIDGIDSTNISKMGNIPVSFTEIPEGLIVFYNSEGATPLGWESLTAPDGWVLCDGTNGTPDMRDAFIRPVTTGSENTTPTGDNTLDFAQITVNQNATHDHQGASIGRDQTGNRYHPSASWSHSHTLSAVNDISWLPPYYALSFIMKAA